MLQFLRLLTATQDDGNVVVKMKGDVMAPAPMLMTIDDYFATPETVKPAELAFGALRVAESPTTRHQSTVKRLLLALEDYATALATRGAPLPYRLRAEIDLYRGLGPRG